VPSQARRLVFAAMQQMISKVGSVGAGTALTAEKVAIRTKVGLPIGHTMLFTAWCLRRVFLSIF